MIKELSIIVEVFGLRAIDGPIADHVFEAPIIFPVTAHMMELDLAGF